jgi:hypothetical protein
MKVKITKNIIRKGEVGFGLTLPQIIIGVCGLAVGLGMFLMLKDKMSLNLLMTLIFIVMALFIMFGIVRVDGMSLGAILISTFKGVDKRPYCVEGVCRNEPVQKEKK